MFCPNCGKEIEDSSRFCRYCGTNITTDIPREPKSKPEKKESSGCFFKVLLWSFVGLMLLFPLPSIGDCANSQACAGNTNSTRPLSRAATNADIQIDFSDPSLMRECITIRPYRDIDNLKITISYLDKKGNTITTEQRTIGNVKEGIEYNTYLNTLELPASTDKYSVRVTGGTVFYFQ